MARVELVEPDAPGLAAMIGGLIEAGIADPVKARLLDEMRGTVSIIAADADVEIGLAFGEGVCRVYPTALPGSTVSLEMPAESLMAMSTMPTIGPGLPDLRSPDARTFLKQVLKREVRIGGFWHTKLLNQLTALLKV